MRSFPFLLSILALSTIAAGYALSTETKHMHRECVAKGNGQAECSLKLYGR